MTPEKSSLKKVTQVPYSLHFFREVIGSGDGYLKGERIYQHCVLNGW